MKSVKLAIVGLGYVGLPLAKLLSTKYPVVGLDINQEKIEELNRGFNIDLKETDHLLVSLLVYENPFHTGEDQGMFCTTDIRDIEKANSYFIAVTNPLDKRKDADLCVR